MKAFLLVVVAAIVVVGLTGCGTTSSGSSSGQQVSREDYGGAWPLTVDSGTLRCESPAGESFGAVTFTSDEDGTTYWVNGTAGNIAEEKGWQEIRPIWADDPTDSSGLGLKKSMGPLIDAGLALCGE